MKCRLAIITFLLIFGFIWTAQAQQAETTLVVWVAGFPADEQIQAEVDRAREANGPVNNQTRVAIELREQFEAQHPGVTVVFQDRGWTTELTANLQRAVLGGVGPDVVAGESQVVELAQLGLFRAIDASDIKGLIPGTLKGATHEGVLYGLPYITGTFGLQFNRDVLRQAGYDPEADIPETWDELLAMSQDITAKGNGEYYGFMVDAAPGLGSIFRFDPWLKQLGTGFGTEDGGVIFNSPEHLRVYEFVRELSLTSPPGAAAMTDEGQILSQIHSGRAAFQIDGPWQLDWAAGAGCDCGYAKLPLPDAGRTGNTIVGNAFFSVLSDSKNPELAEAFVRWTASAEGQAIWLQNDTRLPTNTDSLKLVPDFFERFPDLEAFFTELTESDNVAPLPNWRKNPSRILDTWTELKTAILDPRQDIQQAADRAQQQAEDHLR